MKKNFLIVSAFLLLTTFSANAQKATVTRISTSFDIVDDIVYCAGKEIITNGKINLDVHTTVNGKISLLHESTNGLLIGMTETENYLVRINSNITSIAKLEQQHNVYNQQQMIRLVSTGGGPNYRIIYNIKATANSQGMITFKERSFNSCVAE
jgi:hypothetical protein